MLLLLHRQNYKKRSVSSWYVVVDVFACVVERGILKMKFLFLLRSFQKEYSFSRPFVRSNTPVPDLLSKEILLLQTFYSGNKLFSHHRKHLYEIKSRQIDKSVLGEQNTIK